eukprot:m.16486 g.16486  ORF g.16486 m.16486 type:complete len:51 (+) comp9022_c0_seq1:73-225(+)
MTHKPPSGSATAHTVLTLAGVEVRWVTKERWAILAARSLDAMLTVCVRCT